MAGSTRDIVRRAARPDRPGGRGHRGITRDRTGHRPDVGRSRRRRGHRLAQARRLRGRGRGRAGLDGSPSGRRRLPRGSVGRLQSAHRRVAHQARSTRHLREQRGHVSALREPGRRERGALRQDDRRQSEGAVPARGVGRHPHELPYACAKAGLNALTVGLAEAYAPKVRVNAILPGPVRTDISKAWAPEGAAVGFVPLGRIGDPEEVAPLALHLASAASSFTTGAIIRVDGGITRKV
jgi:NAD(P)-dependent dehydrogenase (short-subunit alcohol dehydrogenase family)